MWCPGCKKESLITLSVCPSCGTMAADSVREELAKKITIIPKTGKTLTRRDNVTVQKPSSQFKLNPPPSPVLTQTKVKPETAEISSKKTNRTLVEFQSKDGTVPEWRTQLRNAVRQRQLQQTPERTGAATAVAYSKPDLDEGFFDSSDVLTESSSDTPQGDLLANALKRIESSRQKFHIVETASPKKAASPKPRPAAVPEKVKKEELRSGSKESDNASQTQSFSPNVDLYDTSELDPEFVPAKVSSSFGKVSIKTSAAPDSPEVGEIGSLPEPCEPEPAPVEDQANESEIDDRAPFGYRFNAGLFDMLTASFVSLILLAPFMLLGGNWFTIAGLFAFLATCSIVNFIYLTTTIGLFGKSFGMHLFSLEMIDADAEEYPTLHQAAVSSSVFLLSLAFGGAGFVTCLFDEDGRAIHDLVSNTLVVKELQ